jgi:hypothetical protein
MQILVNSHVFTFDSSPTGQEIKDQLHLVDKIPVELITLTLNGLNLNNEEIVDEDSECILRALISNGLCGGKGGFGANLRSLAKQKGKTKTTDFGACRDLSGRRLRHINDEIILSKWKEAKDKGEEFDTEEETATGIDLWYLSAPSWAEGIKVDKRKKFMKPRMKTTLCIDWLRARETKDAPSGAPVHWGCPRGARCEFAHGEDELKGEALAAMKESKKQAKTDEVTKKRDDYLNVMSRAAKDDEEVGELVMAGLRAAKRAKMAESRKIIDGGETTEKLPVSVVEPVVQSLVDGTAPTQGMCSSSAVELNDINLLRSRSTGEVRLDTDQFTAVGVLSFGTVCAPHCVATEGAWYYEVELRSDGLMQIGWVSNAFASRAAVEGDGVGDDVHSWAFDGYRQKAWHGGVEREYGPQTGEIWRVGDVVGCFLHLDCANAHGSISYSLNGVHFGPAFELQLGEVDSSFSPALSLEGEERVTLNLGQEAFAFPPQTTTLTSLSLGNSSEHSTDYRAVWLSIDPSVLQLNGFNAQLAPVKDENEGEIEGQRNQPSSSHNTTCDDVKPDCVDAVNKNDAAGETAVAPITPSVKSAAPPPAAIVIFQDVDINSPQLESSSDLAALGMGQLRHELEKRGLKTGGTAVERASRLMAFRGLKSGETVDKKLLAKLK